MIRHPLPRPRLPRRRTVPVLVLALLAGCSSPPPAPPPPPKPAIAEGFYRGTSTRFQANKRTCPRPGLVSFVVADRRFQYRWAWGVYVDAEIREDGTIEGYAPGISLLGRYADNRIQGDVTNGDCGLHFTVTLKDR